MHVCELVWMRTESNKLFLYFIRFVPIYISCLARRNSNRFIWFYNYQTTCLIDIAPFRVIRCIGYSQAGCSRCAHQGTCGIFDILLQVPNDLLVTFPISIECDTIGTFPVLASVRITTYAGNNLSIFANQLTSTSFNGSKVALERTIGFSRQCNSTCQIGIRIIYNAKTCRSCRRCRLIIQINSIAFGSPVCIECLRSGNLYRCIFYYLCSTDCFCKPANECITRAS